VSKPDLGILARLLFIFDLSLSDRANGFHTLDSAPL
jgi:hypothetical protein